MGRQAKAVHQTSFSINTLLWPQPSRQGHQIQNDNKLGEKKKGRESDCHFYLCQAKPPAGNQVFGRVIARVLLFLRTWSPLIRPISLPLFVHFYYSLLQTSRRRCCLWVFAVFFRCRLYKRELHLFRFRLHVSSSSFAERRALHALHRHARIWQRTAFIWMSRLHLLVCNTIYKASVNVPRTDDVQSQILP